MVNHWKSVFKSKWFWIAFISLVVLVVGVPILINELYKQNKGYITVWGGEDVLSYYGTLLGATATIIALYFTIKSTRAQIASERYVSIQREKWGQIERLFRIAISLAQPLTLCSIYTTGLSKQGTQGCSELQQHIYNVKSAIDDIRGTVTESDELIVKDLLAKLQKIAQKVEMLSNDYFDLLLAFRASKDTDTANNKPVMTAMLLAKQKNITDKVNELHEKDYQELLTLKKVCFGEVYTKIDEKAKTILYSNK